MSFFDSLGDTSILSGETIDVHGDLGFANLRQVQRWRFLSPGWLSLHHVYLQYLGFRGTLWSFSLLRSDETYSSEIRSCLEISHGEISDLSDILARSVFESECRSLEECFLGVLLALFEQLGIIQAFQGKTNLSVGTVAAGQSVVLSLSRSNDGVR